MQPPSSDPSPQTQPMYASAQLANVAAAVHAFEHPKQIGPYQIESVVGEGGMGTVYKAQQHSPIRRTVAVKVVKLGMDTREVVLRFEGERQALALMNHPNVARVLDAGATETGRPYFVMEFVQGEPITAFADRQQLTVRQRLELFIQACDAVQHAHQKAIIHRDLKPSNILVTLEDGVARVKVIDFGVAKALEQRLTEKTLFTQTGQLVGTPEYMPPEQAEAAMADIDTRSDVYSLGVVLYELLSGTLPFDARTLRSGGYHEIQRIIREVAPPRPSTRLSSLGSDGEQIAQKRQTLLASLSQELRTELEWIPLKAIRKERDQRYATAAELAEDIGNYLNNRPLRAGPESAAYRIRKFLRRNKRGVIATTAMIVLLLAGIIATTWQAIRATRAEARTRLEQARTLVQKQEADRRREDAEQARSATAQVNDFLVGMFESVEPQQARGKPVLVSDILDVASAEVARKLAGQPKAESAVRSALGRTYFALGLYDRAEPHFQTALELDRRTLGENDPQTLGSMQQLGRLRRAQGNFDETHRIYREVLQRRRSVLGEDHVDTIGSINDVAVILDRLGSPDAEAMYREARQRFIAKLGPDDPESLRFTGNLGQFLERIGRFEEAERLLRESYEGRKRVLGVDHPDTIAISSRLAFVMRYRKAWSEAEALMRDALERTIRIEGPNHPKAVFAEGGLAILLTDQGKHDEAVELYRANLERCRRALSSENIDALGVLQSAASGMANAGRVEEAERLYKECIASVIKARGGDFHLAIRASQNYCMMLRRQERWEDALPLAEDGYKRLREPGRIAFEPRQRAAYLSSYGIVLSHLGRHDEAMEPLAVARAAFRATEDLDTDPLAQVLRCLVKSAEALGRAGDAAKWSAELARLSPATTTAASQPSQ